MLFESRTYREVHVRSVHHLVHTCVKFTHLVLCRTPPSPRFLEMIPQSQGIHNPYLPRYVHYTLTSSTGLTLSLTIDFSRIILPSPVLKRSKDGHNKKERANVGIQIRASPPHLALTMCQIAHCGEAALHAHNCNTAWVRPQCCVLKLC